MLSILNKARRKRLDGEQGFTLIELLVVVVILGILIAIAIPVYLNYRKSANDKAAQSDLRGAISTLEVCNSNGAYPSAITTGTAGTMTGCGVSGGTATTTLPLSTGTNVGLYSTTTTGGAIASFIMTTYNSGGTPKYYCYNSANGGAISSVATATTTC